MRPKLIYTDRSLPLILEALGIKEEGEFIIWEGKRVKKSSVIGFKKDIGIITK